ncbi:peptidase inhibitor family I36 protein [Streptomyces sp. NPDC093071]|uniref:peptidase inhibitor family I36 protein n=1 Tax=Streptomyces sp. NPDC093071 TaxID=3366022 RepID=UPI003827E2C0
MKITTLRAVLTASVLALFGSALVAWPASAAGYEACPTASLCLYSAADGVSDEGDAVHAYGVTANADAQSYGAWSDRAESLYNNSPYWACLYAESRSGGEVKAVAPGAKGNLAALAPNLGGKVNSHKLAPSQGHCFTGFERCADDTLCLFQEPSGRGRTTGVTQDYRAYHPDVWANQVESVVNRTEKTACFYTKHLDRLTAADRPFRVLPGDATSISGSHANTFNSHRFSAEEDCS